jgi:hypothetical protein
MSKVDDTTTSNADYRLPADGPHRYVKKKVDSQKEKESEAPYVISVVKEREGEPVLPKASSKYDPKELRAKAKNFLKNPEISSHQKQVLEDILGPDEEKKT